MNSSRLLPALVLTAGLLAVSGVFAQPPGAPDQPIPGGRAGLGPDKSIPVLPKSAGAFVTLKVSDLANHPDLKQVLAELAKQPEALTGITEVTGVSPLEMDRVTLFWPRLNAGGRADPILVVTTRQPFNEARVLKALKADPVFDNDFRGVGARWKAGSGGSAPKASVQVADPDERKIPGPVGPPPGGKDAGSPKEKSKQPAPPPKDVGQPKPDPIPPLEPGKPQQDDLCAPAADSGPSDPLFYSIGRGPFEALFLIDENTLVFLPSVSDGGFSNLALLAATLKKNATGPLADAITTASKHTFAAGVNLTPIFRELERFPSRELVPYTALFAARTAVLTGDLTDSALLNLTLTFDDATAAKRAAPVLEEGIATITEKLAGFVAELKESRRPMEKATAPLVAAFLDGLKKVTVKADGSTVAASATVAAGPVVAKALGEMLQAVQSRQKAVARMNNLKQIGIALHSYHDTMGRFPTNVYGPKGELLLSWRVHLLPYLEEDNLYRQFKLDEPWDSANNKPLSEKLPKVFMAPDREHAKGMTFYQAFIGPPPGKALPKGVFGRAWLQEGDKNGIRFTDILDGSSNTIAVIEARDGVIWSKPDDLPFGGVVPPLGEKGWDRAPALRFDGSCFLVPTNLKPEEFWPFITINGGEVTPDFDDDRRPFGGGRPIGPGVGQEPVPSNPIPPKPAGGPTPGDIRNLEEEVAVLTVIFEKEQARATLAETSLKRTMQLFATGTVAQAELDKAKAVAEEARVRADDAAVRLQHVKTKLEAAKTALDKAPKGPPK